MTKGVTGRLHGPHAGAQGGQERGAVRYEILQDARQRIIVELTGLNGVAPL